MLDSSMNDSIDGYPDVGTGILEAEYAVYILQLSNDLPAGSSGSANQPAAYWHPKG